MTNNRLCSLLIAFVIFLTFVLSSLALTVCAVDISYEEEEKKIYSRATIEDDFADNRVMIVMNHDISMELKEYGANDFSEINVKSTIDLSSATREKASAQLDKINSALFNRTFCAIHALTRARGEISLIPSPAEKGDRREAMVDEEIII